jgi:hypothetical protein
MHSNQMASDEPGAVHRAYRAASQASR